MITSGAFNSSNSLKKDLVNLVHSLFVELCNIAKYICFTKSHGVSGYYDKYEAFRGWTCKLISAIILINMTVVTAIASYILLNKMKYYLQNGKSTSMNKTKLHILEVLANKDSLQQIIPVILQFSFFWVFLRDF